MTATALLALTGFAFVSSVTPGPNNMMLMASGANFGLRRTVPHMLGVALGFGAMIAILGLGVDRALHDAPRLLAALKIASLAYMLWLGWKIAHAAPPGPPEGGIAAEAAAAPTRRPLTFLQAAAFQWVNPKAWAMALGALAAYAAAVGGVWVVAAVFTAINLPSVGVWAAAGQGLRRWLSSPGRLRAFNWTMAGLLIASMLPVLWEM